MKKILFIFTCLVVFVFTSNAQYKINKTQYNPKQYVHEVGNPYNPTVAGLTSFFIPGLGQMFSGEFVRGLTFLGIWGGSFAAILYGFEDAEALFFGGMIVFLVTPIWAIIDAVKVAKVNNMAWRDRQGNVLSLQVNPYIGANTINNSNPVGLSVRLNF